MPYLKLNVKALIIIGAVFWGAYLFLAALFAMGNIQTLWFSSESFSIIASIYPGLEATAVGAFIGLVWGVICGAICGWLVARGYNLASDRFD